ncbi:alpha/beta hydrolase [Hyphococcus flavus]|uniref:Alpha/beta hydrolase n=1 Tax=Hyphococcus flavus TaxID=1866326 RepID=A0AAE9ZB31_9PROT|nr:alpha/beta hydrolase [Hyphococcus flavus]WDI30706.1 alpha/beta hydrolase [Hyphococcus flavus]
MYLQRPSNHVIYWDEIGDPKGMPLILVLGLGIQIPSWPRQFYDQLSEAGFRVIRFDNRDAGLSAAETKSRNLNPVEEYDLSAIADDLIAILDAAKIPKAMMFGVSLGGIIAQLAALKEPDRFTSVTFYMSTSGAPDLPLGKPEALAAIFKPADISSLEAYVQNAISIRRKIESKGVWTVSDNEIKEFAEACYARYISTEANSRQSNALMRQDSWHESLSQLKNLRTTVIHGNADPLIPFECGADLAHRTNSEFIEVPYLGHELNTKIANLLVYHLIKERDAVLASAVN